MVELLHRKSFNWHKTEALFLMQKDNIKMTNVIFLSISFCEYVYMLQLTFSISNVKNIISIENTIHAKRRIF